MAGRPPKPTKLKLIQGNPGKRALPEFEPDPERGIPAPPRWFPAEYFDLWAEIAPTLEEMRVLSLADGPALVLLGCFQKRKGGHRHDSPRKRVIPEPGSRPQRRRR